MPQVTVRGVRYHYQEKGHGPETIVFAHGFLMNHAMFRPQIEAFQNRYRCIAFDWRGQGNSESTVGGYDMDNLTRDAAEFITMTEAAPCHWVGVSMGGFVGLRLGARHAELVQSLTLAETSAQAEKPENRHAWKKLAWVFLLLGARPIEARILPILLGTRVLTDPAKAELVSEIRANLRTLKRLPTFKIAMAVVNRSSVADQLHTIKTPTLVITGEQDAARSHDEARFIQRGVDGAGLSVIAGAGHSSPTEEPEAFNTTLGEFLTTIPRRGAGTNQSANTP